MTPEENPAREVAKLRYNGVDCDGDTECNGREGEQGGVELLPHTAGRGCRPHCSAGLVTDHHLQHCTAAHCTTPFHT